MFHPMYNLQTSSGVIFPPSNLLLRSPKFILFKIVDIISVKVAKLGKHCILGLFDSNPDLSNALGRLHICIPKNISKQQLMQNLGGSNSVLWGIEK